MHVNLTYSKKHTTNIMIDLLMLYIIGIVLTLIYIWYLFANNYRYAYEIITHSYGKKIILASIIIAAITWPVFYIGVEIKNMGEHK